MKQSKAAKLLIKKYKKKMNELNVQAKQMSIQLHALHDDSKEEAAIHMLRRTFRDNRSQFEYYEQEVKLMNDLDTFIKA